MNKVSYYFSELVKELHIQCDEKSDKNCLALLLTILSMHFEKLLKEDKKFMDRIANCTVNFSALNLVVNRNVNKTENTLKTISCCLNHGIIVWNRRGEKVSFKIKTYIPEYGDQSFVMRSGTFYEENKFSAIKKDHVVSPIDF